MTRRLLLIGLAFLAMTACGMPETPMPVTAASAQGVDEAEMLRRKIAQMEEENALREQYITEVTQTLAAVQENLTKLRVAQNELQRQWSSIEQRQQVTASQRDELLQQLEDLHGELESNGTRLAEARRRAETAESKVAQLLPLISQLQNDLTRRDHEIASLRTTVGRLEIEVKRRDEVIETKNKAIVDRDRELDDKARQLARADLEKNLIYYRIDTVAALQKEKLIVREGGLFGSRFRGVWLPADKLDPSEFNPIDRRELREFAVDAPVDRAQIVTQHDPQSFRHEPLTRTVSVIRILDPEKFWAAGRFLIVAKR